MFGHFAVAGRFAECLWLCCYVIVCGVGGGGGGVCVWEGGCGVGVCLVRIVYAS